MKRLTHLFMSPFGHSFFWLFSLFLELACQSISTREKDKTNYQQILAMKHFSDDVPVTEGLVRMGPVACINSEEQVIDEIKGCIC